MLATYNLRCYKNWGIVRRIRNIYLFIRKHFGKRAVESPWNSDGANRILAWDRTSHGCCVLCWGRLDAILFSPSLPSLFSPSISPAIFFLSSPSFSVFPSLLSFLLFLFLSSYTQCAPPISVLLRALPSIPPLPPRHPHELGLVVPSGNGCPTYTQACASSARICVGLYCVRWKVRRGNRWIRIYVSRIIRVYV